MLHFILIRHGETSWTKEKRYQGSTNTQLTTLGKKQIQRFSKEITRYQPDIIFSSALDRSRESAEILCSEMNIKPTVDKRLNEMSFGRWEGKTANKLIEEGNKRYDRWMKGGLATPQGGETVAALRKRVKSFINDTVKKHDDKKIVIVTHGGTIRMFFIELLKLPMKTCLQFRIDPGTMTIISKNDYSTQMVLLNSTTPKKGIVPHGCV